VSDVGGNARFVRKSNGAQTSRRLRESTAHPSSSIVQKSGGRALLERLVDSGLVAGDVRE
jgi:hypothetical protein